MTKQTFKNLAEYHAERDRLKNRVRGHELSLLQYRSQLNDSAFRGQLLRNGVRDVFSGIRPLRFASRLIYPDTGPLSSIIAGLLGARARTFKGKIMTWGLALALPPVLKLLSRSAFFKQAMDAFLSRTDDEDEHGEPDEGQE